MIFEEVKRYLSNIIDMEGVRELGKKKDHILICCPMARWTHKGGIDRHPSFMVWFSDDKQTYYKCYSCGESGHLWSLFNEYGQKVQDATVQALALEILKVDTPTLASKFVKLHNKIASKHDNDPQVTEAVKIIPDRLVEKYELAILNPLSSAYLKSRGVDDLTALRFNLRWDKHSYRVCFPVYDDFQTCVGMVGRTIPPGDVEKRRYYNYFNFDASESLGGYNFIKDYEYNKVLVLEGYFDVLNCWGWCLELGILPLCTWKAKVSKPQFKLLERLDKAIISGYDNDDAGNNGKNKLIEEGGWTGLNIKTLQLPKDKDVGELTKQEFTDSLQNTKTRLSRRFSNV